MSRLSQLFAGLALLTLFGPAPVAGQLKPTRIVVPTIDDDAEATWKKLTWEDFRKDLDSWRREAAGIASQVVLGRTRIQTEERKGEFFASLEVVETYAIMSKLESGYKPGGRSDWTLAHEQGHFDITEVCARRFRSKLPDIEASGPTPRDAADALQREIKPIYLDAIGKCNALQARYDGETRHGLKKKAQREWWQTLETWLSELPAQP